MKQMKPMLKLKEAKMKMKQSYPIYKTNQINLLVKKERGPLADPAPCNSWVVKKKDDKVKEAKKNKGALSAFSE